MAKLKLPEQLKEWKVLSPVSESQSYPSFNIVKTEFDGTQTAAVLTYVNFEDSDYNGEHVDLINEEAAFVKSLIKLRGVSNYIDAIVNNEPAKNSISLYLVTNDAKPIKKILGNSLPTDNEIVDFGLQISEILDKLEQNNILHGNLKPDNVYITAEGSLLLGGFTAFDSNAADLSYTAPEMAAGDQPDHTTDIYSLGLMMYAMANDGKLPFEDEGVSRSAATEKRLSKATVTAPSHGNEKLKSVIVIACQPENKNRWKNAGNIKNALASIKAELPSSQAKPAKKLPVQESTAFESNVFEEFAFDEIENAPAPAKNEKPVIEKSAREIAQGAAVAAALASQHLKDASKGKGDNDKTQIASSSDNESEIDNRVFDNYQPETKVFKLNDSDQNNSENYGDFFEDEPKSSAPAATGSGEEETFENGNFFENIPEEEDDDREPAKRGKSFIIGIIVVIAAVTLAVTALVVLAVQNGWFSSNKSDEKADETTAAPTAEVITTAATTNAATTAPSTTVAETTEPETEPPENVTPENVVGYFYDYAVEVLEGQGFTVDYSERKYSDEYDEDYVIAMSPDSSEPAKYGSTIKLVLSRGSEHPKESSDEDSTESSSSDDSDSSDEGDGSHKSEHDNEE